MHRILTVTTLLALTGAPGAWAQTTDPYAPLAPLIGEWDTGPAGSPPAFVQRFSWGPDRGYVMLRTTLSDGAGTERLHFEGPIMWNGATRRFDYLFAVEPGSLSQEQGEIRVVEGGDLVRDVTLTSADGSVARFRQTFHELGHDRFETSLMRQTATGWAPTFPGSDRLVMMRRPE